MTILAGKPWETAAADALRTIYYPRGMIGPEERRAFYWLARNYITGAGHVVDAGSFIGASSFCFAAGAAEAGLMSFQGRPIIQAYDYFAAFDEYVADAITRDFCPIKQGDSYLDIYEYQTSRYASMIESHSGDFLSHQWDGNPIEILFIDLAKTQALGSHIIGEMFPSLIPGRSIVIHQDYYHCWHPHIHITMEYLDNYFELVDERVPHQSRIWLLKKSIPKVEIDRMHNYDLTAAERMTLLDRLVEKSSSDARPMIEVVRMWQRVCDGELDAAKADFEELRRCYAVEDRPELWAKQALEIAIRLNFTSFHNRTQ